MALPWDHTYRSFHVLLGPVQFINGVTYEGRLLLVLPIGDIQVGLGRLCLISQVAVVKDCIIAPVDRVAFVPVLNLDDIGSVAIEDFWVDEIGLVLAAVNDDLLAAISVGAAILVVIVFHELLFRVLPDVRCIWEIGDFCAILHELSEHFSSIERAVGIAAIVK
jgi:hypothetical protein